MRLKVSGFERKQLLVKHKRKKRKNIVTANNNLFDMSEHVPAWKRITIKKNQQRQSTNGNDEDDDPLNITTHLATGSLTKKQKQKIIRGEDREDTDLPSDKKAKTDKKKKEKLPREERDAKKQGILKDQLRYLIDFYLTKINPEKLPESLSSFPNVRNNYPEKFNSNNPTNDTEDQDSKVIEVWKFSKQKQNWLIKHFFSIDQIPPEYDQLLLSYFKELKSPAIKEGIITSCRENMDKWNQYIDKNDEKMRKIVEGEDDTDKNDIEDKDQEKKESEETSDNKDLGDVNQKKKEQEQKEQEQQEEELTPPDKRVLNRSQQLLKLWAVEPLVELKRFHENEAF